MDESKTKEKEATLSRAVSSFLFYLSWLHNKLDINLTIVKKVPHCNEGMYIWVGLFVTQERFCHPTPLMCETRYFTGLEGLGGKDREIEE